MNRTISALLAVVALAPGLGGCAQDANEEQSEVVETALVGQDTFLYLRCSSTSWELTDASRLSATADPYLFEVAYDVKQSWMVTGGDSCVLTETNALNAWGTKQSNYGSRFSQVVIVPGGAPLQGDSGNFTVRYPQLGRYKAVINWRDGAININPVDAAKAWEPKVSGKISAIELHPVVKGAGFVGYDNGDLYWTAGAESAAPGWTRRDEWTDPSGGRHSLPDSAVTTIATNPLNYRHSIVGFAGTKYGPKVYSSANGYTWEQLTNIPVGEAWGLSFNPLQPAIVYAYGLNGAAASSDYGRTWTGTGIDPLKPPMAADSKITAVTTGNELKHVILGTNAGELYMTFDAVAGSTWIRLDNTLMPKRPVTRVTVAPGGMQPPELYVTYAGIKDDSVWVSRNGGQSWVNIHAAGLPTTTIPVSPLSMLGVSVNPKNTNLLYLGYTYTAFSSSDRGLTWR